MVQKVKFCEKEEQGNQRAPKQGLCLGGLLDSGVRKVFWIY